MSALYHGLHAQFVNVAKANSLCLVCALVYHGHALVSGALIANRALAIADPSRNLIAFLLDPYRPFPYSRAIRTRAFTVLKEG